MKNFTGWLICGAITLAMAPAINPLYSRDVETLKIGAKAPDFELPGVDGKTYSLADFKDARLLVVLFTCNHCPTAQAYEERIKKLYSEYRPRDVAMVAISPNDALAVRLDELGYTDLGDSLEDMKIRAEQQQFEFPYLYDGETQRTSAAYGVRATPHIYIFDEKRTLRYVGRIDDNEIGEPKSRDARAALDSLLAGEEVKVPVTPAFGCSTKWADKREAAEKVLEKWNKESVALTAISPAALKKRLTEKSEKYRLVNVWATWCIPCVEEMDEFVTIHRMYRKRHFELITVSADTLSDQDRALKVLTEKHCSASNYILDSESRADLFESVDPQWQGAVPYTLLIDPNGKVVHRIHDEVDALELRREIVKHIGRTYASRK